MSAFREEYRRAHVGPRYSGLLHLAVTTTGAVAGIAAALSQVHELRALELLTVPLAFLFANFVEHQAHKRLLHVPRGPLKFLFVRHTLQHHKFFLDDELSVSSSRDWKIVLFPPAVIVFFLGGIGLPSMLLMSAAVSQNVGALFGATAAGYFLVYDYCHLAWHQDDDSWVARLPGVRRFREHHRAHHRDATRGFNVTFPITDALLR